MELRLPVLIVNFKAYETSIGKNAVELAKICEKVANDMDLSIAVAVQAADIHAVSSAVKIPVFAQHIDPVDPGSHTGSVLAEDVKENGAVGTLLNHSENRLRIDVIAEAIKQAKDAGLITVVCANTPDVGEAIDSFQPDFVAVEPPELIGGDVSVTSSDPGIITESIKKINDQPGENKVIVGAGVKTTDDVKKAVELGSVGVLVASGVTKAEDPEKAVRELAEGLK